jgi:hypothetical protein
MKKQIIFYLFFLFLIHFQALFSQSNLSEGEKIVTEDGFFDPLRDPIGRKHIDGTIKLCVPRATLIRSIQANKWGSISEVYVVTQQKIDGADYLVLLGNLEGRALYINVLLRQDLEGRFFAGDQFNRCEAIGCADCLRTSQVCSCMMAEDPYNPVAGFCNHTIGWEEMLMQKVKF